MHRTKVTVVEEALDANNTIAGANRADFDRAGVTVINFMSAPGAGNGIFSRATGQPGVLQPQWSPMFGWMAGLGWTNPRSSTCPGR